MIPSKRKNYLPYGPEWEKELMRFNKKGLIAMIRHLCKKKNQAVAAKCTCNPHDLVYYGCHCKELKDDTRTR